jgi:hypothetical protein
MPHFLSWALGRAASFLRLYFLCVCLNPLFPLYQLIKRSSRVISLLIFPLCWPQLSLSPLPADQEVEPRHFFAYIFSVPASRPLMPHCPSWALGQAATFLGFYFLCVCLNPSHAPLPKLGMRASNVISLLILPYFLCVCLTPSHALYSSWARGRAVSFLCIYFLCVCFTSLLPLYQAAQEVEPRHFSVYISSVPALSHYVFQKRKMELRLLDYFYLQK